MKRVKFKYSTILKKGIAAASMLAIIFTSSGIHGAPAQETPEMEYSGIKNVGVVLNNLNYTDIKNASSLVKETVYETGALNLIKSYGNKNFGLSTTLSKEDAIMAVYTAAGRTAEAQKLAENLDSSRQKDNKKTNPLNMWADGFLQLAANEGLISQQDLSDAFLEDQSELESGSFNRKAAAQRQEVASWLAKALKLEPVNDQQAIFNSFMDWKRADPPRIPYIEALLQHNIMSGDAKGYFKPSNPVNRGEMAQMIKNAEDLLLPVHGMERKAGTIEGIADTKNYEGGKPVTVRTYNVRNSGGMLHIINAEYSGNNAGGTYKNSISDLVVLKNGSIGNSSLLKVGDRIEYITSSDNTVRFIKVLSSIYDTKYYVVRVNNINTEKRTINTSVFFKLDYPDMNLLKTSISFDPGTENATMNYIYSNNVLVIQENRKVGLSAVKPESYLILTVKNNVVTEMRTLEAGNKEEGNVVRGIVEDNNPQLGYITLYNEDGTGVVSPTKQLDVLRTYNYGNQNELEVFKNYSKTGIEEIEVGDTVFLKLDQKREVVSVSAADNYIVKYGKVVTKGASVLGIKYDNGTQQVLNVDKNVLVVADKRLVSYSRLQAGDRVRLLVNATNKFTSIKEITIEGDESFIANIYKAKIDYIDKTSDKLVAKNVQTFYNGRWIRTDHKGFTGMKLGEEYKMYFDNKEVDLNKADKYLRDNEAYIAVQKDYGGEERAVFISFRNESDKEDEPYEDSIAYAVPGTGEFNISKKQDMIRNGEGTIVVKDGRLVSASSISSGDKARIIANRSSEDGNYYAGIVQISNNPGMEAVQIYRGRIKQINELKSFTVESFSQLKGLLWEYSNTPKTFDITYSTRIIDDTGLVSQRDFADFGTNNYANRTVYVIADNTGALLVTTTPYGTVNARGEVYAVTGAVVGEEGTLLAEPTGIKIIGAKVYDLSRYMWIDSKDMALKILDNTIVFKNEKIVKPSEIKNGDKVRVIKKDATETGDAYIVIIES